MSCAAPAATSKPSKSDNIMSGNLFDDLENAQSPKLKAEIKENLPMIKKPGAWDSDVIHSMSRPKTIYKRAHS